MRFLLASVSVLVADIDGFVLSPSFHGTGALAASAKGFGAGSSSKKQPKVKKSSLIDALQDKPKAAASAASKPDSTAKPYVKSEHDDLIASLAMASSKTAIGQAVASSPYAGTSKADPFWELMPSLLSSRFPTYKDDQLKRVAGMIRYAVNPNLPLEDAILEDSYRPHQEIHAYMPGLGPTKPFYDPEDLPLCQRLTENYDIISKEYHALLQDIETSGKDRFQSVTSMNYESGWKTLVLFYNGHRIPGFPYRLCPVTTRLLESVPLAGRIAGFNRQQPQTGIPLHSDGNNMWLTCQMGIVVPDDEKAYIRVGPDTRRWTKGGCLLYDTTYEHETKNDHPTQERVVLHVDFFNTLAMTPIEIEVMQYIYSLREEFMKAEGVAKVGAQIL